MSDFCLLSAEDTQLLRFFKLTKKMIVSSAIHAVICFEKCKCMVDLVVKKQGYLSIKYICVFLFKRH